MNGKDFYKEFKILLDSLQVGFHGMDQVQISGELVLSSKVDGKQIDITWTIDDEAT